MKDLVRGLFQRKAWVHRGGNTKCTASNEGLFFVSLIEKKRLPHLRFWKFFNGLARRLHQRITNHQRYPKCHVTHAGLATISHRSSFVTDDSFHASPGFRIGPFEHVKGAFGYFARSTKISFDHLNVRVGTQTPFTDVRKINAQPHLPSSIFVAVRTILLPPSVATRGPGNFRTIPSRHGCLGWWGKGEGRGKGRARFQRSG